MKFIPILFSTPMVQAINEGRKTMTRRVMKPQPDENGVSYMRNPPIPWEETYKQPWKPWLYDTDEGERIATLCPYGQIGDVLWVRETFYAFGHWIEVKKDGKKAMEFVDETQVRNLKYHHKNNRPDKVQKKRLIRSCAWYKRPSLFMPKAACRTFLEITNIRVERLEDISYSDAIAEGINYVIDKVTGFCGYDYFGGGYNVMTTPANSFFSLWRKVQGLNKYDKTGNPYVWVIEFKRIEKPENFN